VYIFYCYLFIVFGCVQLFFLKKRLIILFTQYSFKAFFIISPTKNAAHMGFNYVLKLQKTTIWFNNNRKK